MCVWVLHGVFSLFTTTPRYLSSLDVTHGSGASGSLSPFWIIWSILNPTRYNNRYLKKSRDSEENDFHIDHRQDTGK
jgi:hypothetical protein